jgi:putative tricarboxylic transport membrane protein
MQRDFLSGLFWLFLGIALCISSSTYEVGTLTEPKTGFMPLALGLVLIALSFVVVIGAIRLRKEALRKRVVMFTGSWKKSAWTLLVLLATGIFFEELGYLIAFFILSLTLMFIAGLKDWKRLTLIAFCTAIGIYVCFVLLLKQPLPTGLLGI